MNTLNAPRCNSAMLADYGGRTVRIVGKLEGEKATLQASDQGLVTIKLTPQSNWSDEYVEVIGKVDPTSNVVQELASTNLGNKLDLELVDEATKITAQFPDVYPRS